MADSRDRRSDGAGRKPASQGPRSGSSSGKSKPQRKPQGSRGGTGKSPRGAAADGGPGGGKPGGRSSARRDSRSGDTSRSRGAKPRSDDRRDSKRGDDRRTGDRRDSRSGDTAGSRGAKPRADRGASRGFVEERDTSNDLPWPDEIFELELEPDLRADLEAFGGRTETLAKHLLSVQVLAESDPEAAYLHAQRLRDRIPRSALARQTACIAAYRAGRFKDAVKEESAYRRISGQFDLVPIAADSERGLERPQRALAIVSEFDREALDPDTRTELYIVAGGARRDLGDDDAARVLLQKAVRAARSPMASARARYALGDLLLSVGDTEQARKWLQSAVEIDEDGIWTDAAGVLETLT